jgi:hypothetical protein
VIQTCDLRFIRHNSQPIELPFEYEYTASYKENEKGYKLNFYLILLITLYLNQKY